MTDVHATGGEALRVLARELKLAGDTGLRKELYAGLNRASKPLRASAKANAGAILPHRGGLAALVSGASLTARTLTGATAGVRITARAGKRNIYVARLDEGTVEHPVFGHLPKVKQAVEPGWFTTPMEAGGPVVEKELLKVIDEVIRKLHG